jgi:hypothetical protein
VTVGYIVESPVTTSSCYVAYSHGSKAVKSQRVSIPARPSPAEGKNIRNLFEAAPFCPWLRLEACRAICDYALDEPPR